MKFNYKIWCKLLINVLSIGFNVLSFMMFSSFSSAVLLLDKETRSICAMPITFFEQGDLERTRHMLATWHDLRWQRILKFCAIFSLPNLSTLFCAKKPQDKWVDWTFPKPKGRFFVEIILSSKYSWKRNKLSIVIVNMWDSKWMTYPELSFDVTDGHGWSDV